MTIPHLFDFESEKVQSFEKTSCPIRLNSKLTLSNHNTYLSAVDFSNAIVIWEVKTGKILMNISDISQEISAIAMTEELCIAGTINGIIYIFDIERGCISELTNAHDGLINSVSVSDDGTLIISVSNDSFIKIWDSKRQEIVHKIHLKINLDTVTNIRITSNRELCVLSTNNTVFVIDIKQETVTNRLDISSLDYYNGGKIRFFGVTDESSSIKIFLENGNIIYWNLNSNKSSLDASLCNYEWSTGSACIDDEEFEITEEFNVDKVEAISNDGDYILYENDKGVISLLNITNKKFESKLYIINECYISKCNFIEITTDEETRKLLGQYGAIIDKL